MACQAFVLTIMSGHKRHFKDARRARALREKAALVSAYENGRTLPPLERLCLQGGNVFADLGYPHPDQELFKGLLTLEICRIIKERDLTQVQAGAILGVGQQMVSKLLNHHLSTHSPERLIGFLLVLGRDIIFYIERAEEGRGVIAMASESRPSTVVEPGGPVDVRLRELAVRGVEFFSGLGFQQPAQEVLKILLSGGLSRIVDEHIAADVNVGKLLRISRQSVFKLQARDFSSFSVGQLIEYLVILGQNITIRLLPARKSGGIVSVNYPTKMIPTLFPRLFMSSDQACSAEVE